MSQSVRSTGKRVETKGLTKDQKVMRCGQYTATQAGRTQGYSGQTADKNVSPLPESGCYDQGAGEHVLERGTRSRERCQHVLGKQITTFTEVLIRNTYKTKVGREIRRNQGSSWKRKPYSGKLLVTQAYQQIVDNLNPADLQFQVTCSP